MKMRKTLLVLHVATSVGSIGAVASFFVVAIMGLQGHVDIYSAASSIALYCVLPLTVLALVVGIVQSLISPWGLFEHYWVEVKLVATAIVVGALCAQLGNIVWLAELSPSALLEPAAMQAKMSLVVHSAAGLVPIMLAVILSVIKPKGLTRYGWSKRRKGAA